MDGAKVALDGEGTIDLCNRGHANGQGVGVMCMRYKGRTKTYEFPFNNFEQRVTSAAPPRD